MRRTRVVVGACSAVGVVERLFFLPNDEKKDMVGGLAAGAATAPLLAAIRRRHW